MSTSTQSTPVQKSSDSAPIREQILQAGDVLGHCRVIELIAAGGMANVYKVWHEQLEVIRALKILKPGFSEESRGRLETEAKISANIRHTNIVEIYGMGYWNDIPYIEMEYIDGPSLKDLLEKNIRLPVHFSLAVVHSVCTALQFAYNQDMTLYGKVYDRLIHRDIKPANILLNSKGTVKLADFGIARPSEVSIHTVGSKVMGTFAYLSPEQLNGEKLDQRSDVYSLGTVLYEMLTGSKTFPQKLLAELVQKKTRGQFIPVGSMGITLPRQLCSAVEKSLALDRSKRFLDAGEFDVELTASLRKLTVKAAEDIIRTYLKNPYSPGLRPRPLIDFRPVFLTTGIVLGILVVLYLALQLFPVFQKNFSRFKPALIPEVIRLKSSQKESEAVIPPEQSTPVPSPPPQSAPTPKPRPVDPFAQALKSFTAKEYAQAASQLAALNTNLLSPEQKTVRVIRLLQTYLFTNQTEEAEKLVNREPVNDGLFYLIKSTIALNTKQLESALQAAKTAQILPSNYDNSIQQKAAFQIASIEHSRYYLKPNRTNLQTTRESWEHYLEAYCSGDDVSAECIEAKNKLSKLK